MTLLDSENCLIFCFGPACADYLSVPNVLTRSVWSHIVVTFDTGTLTVYKDTLALQGATAYGTFPNALLTGTANDRFQVSDLAGPFAGYLDEIAVWDRALNTTEIAMAYNLGYAIDYINNPTLKNGLKAWYRFGDFEAVLTTNNVPDQSDTSTNNDLVYQGAQIPNVMGQFTKFR